MSTEIGIYVRFNGVLKINWRDGCVTILIKIFIGIFLAEVEPASAQLYIGREPGDAAWMQFIADTDYPIFTTDTYRARSYACSPPSGPAGDFGFSGTPGSGSRAGCGTSQAHAASLAFYAAKQDMELVEFESGSGGGSEKYYLRYNQATGENIVIGRLVRAKYSNKDVGGPSCQRPANPHLGNPIDLASGNKFQEIDDFSIPGVKFRFSRYYNSLSAGDGNTGFGWSTSFGARLNFFGVDASQGVAFRADSGSRAIFRPSELGWVSRKTDRHSLNKISDGWLVADPHGIQLLFDELGNLSAVYEINGRYQSIKRNDQKKIESVTDGFGRSYNFNVDAEGRLFEIRDAIGVLVRYGYDGSIIGLPFLISATHGDGYRQLFNYQIGSSFSALSSIVDETENIFAIWDYDKNGLATRSSHSGGVNSVSIERSDNQVIATMADGLSVTVGMSSVDGLGLVNSLSRPAGSGCSASAQSVQYDESGNVKSVVDFVGKQTCRSYDQVRSLIVAEVAGLETTTSCSSVLSAGAAVPAGARRVSQQWHPIWALEVRRAEPNLITTTVYNGQPDVMAGGAVRNCAVGSFALPSGLPIAVICNRYEQSTSDSDGSQSFAAPVIATRSWSYTYNTAGQVLTETDPRGKVTSRTYWSDTSFTGVGEAARGHTQGDLKSVVNPLGQAIQYTEYNMRGQVLTAVQPNGSTEHWEYHVRGWLTNYTLKPAGNGVALVTRYEYYPTGLLKMETQPDGVFASYAYDAAHRLIDVSDSSGNSVHFRLDNSGNRTAEEFKDPTGQLAKTIKRTYDALGRVQSIEGTMR